MPQSSWQPYTDTNSSRSSYAFRRHVPQRSNELAASRPVSVEPLEVPSSSEQVPAPTERIIPEVVHPVQYGIVPERITLPRPDDEILSSYEEDVSSYGYAIWGTADPGFALMRYLVTSVSAKPVYRSGHNRRHSSPEPECRFESNVPNRLLEQTRLSKLSWNPGPRRGREGAIEEHIARKWNVSALQEAIEYLQHVSLTNHFYITYYAGCAVVFDKDTFHWTSP